MQINLAIAHLLLRHNCVIIPSFGGFVANVSTAQINVQKGIITPPKKVLTFNTNLVNNDGLLANYLSKTEAISFDEANAAVLATCAEWKKDLGAGKRIEIEKVGFLYLDEERNLNFEQNRFFNLLLSSFGLESVHFVADEKQKFDVPETRTAQETITEVADKETLIEEKTPELTAETKADTLEKTASIVAINTPKKKISLWKVAAAAVFIPLAFYTFWIPMRTDVLQSGILLSSDFNPFQQNKTKKYTAQETNFEIAPLTFIPLNEQLQKLPKNVDLFAYHLDEYKYVQLKLNSSEKEDEKLVKTKESNKKTAPFQVITGCFSNENNAHFLVKQLKKEGFAAYVFDKHNGLYRVSANGVGTINQTLDTKEQLKALGFESWVLSL